MRVCVVGAGLAGLAAGDALREAGAHVVVRERLDRVGGRVWTSAVGDGMRVEMGAEFVTEGYEVLPRLAARLGLSLAPMGMSFGDREPRGGIGVGRAALDEACALTAAAVASGDGRGLSFAGLLELLPIEPGARELIACRVAVSYAHPADRIAADAVRDVAHLFSAVEARRIGEGNQALAVRLGDGLDVRRGSPVRRIAQGADGVDVDGERFEGCVVAVPGNAIADIAFEPALPAWKAEALERLAYGAAAKLFVPLRGAAAAPSSVLSVPGRFWTWTAREADGRVPPVVSSFAGSAPAVWPLLQGTTYLEAVADLRPDLDLDAAEALLSTWDAGAYSTREPGRPDGDDAALARPVGRIAFAGEHTERDWFATMEGALRSGHRAAADLRVAANRL